MKIDPRTATIDEIRDWLAEQDGWILEPGVEGDPVWCKAEAIQKWLPHCEEHPEGAQYDHPYPLTLDGAAAAMPEGWFWMRDGAAVSHRQDGLLLKWTACQRGADNWRVVETPDTGNEIDARYRLAAMARQAMGAKEET